MNKRNRVKIHTLSAAMEARLKARRLARELGFDLHDQAYISLATWELAIQTGLGVSRQGVIHINSIEQKDKHQGIQIVCDTQNVSKVDLQAIASGEINSLVDELKIRQLNSNSNNVEISAIKWRK